MLLLKDVIKEANRIYAERKLGEDCYKTPIALRPKMASNQIMSLAEALGNAINNELSVYKTRILELERQLER